MITDADIKKMKRVFVTKEDSRAFATKEDLKQLSDKFEIKFATKEDLKALDSRMDRGFVEIIEFIGETKEKIVSIIAKIYGYLSDYKIFNKFSSPV